MTHCETFKFRVSRRLDNYCDLVTDELELRSTVAEPVDSGRFTTIDDHGGTGTGGEQFQSGKNAYPVRGRIVRGI